MLTTEIKEMPVNKRIILMEKIWDSLCHKRKEIESPTWHKEILDERVNLINSGKANFISIQGLKAANS
ncbi:addiction module component CHP02574 family protein [Candidatus Desantisbacteria bacterium CG2_30_40_21]|uniref:Addiction module component CHP02574 family protein n=5 Tax=unclassified Candidatus Desantisiibacteriota TaxID=3106372 RepID=A0A2M7J845_9BACT|nr:MAG: addiction module component CHP02574 family protein [Candidatus Desantisbacteria bacterium CG2_30_40_21]PIP39589.1 MAG: addiction module component CHP02574 family protein [Candidatus Desantisbacteria bacterium CG23_combo_of_CG06-09_8_20_14_all_40_23]PIX15564.1 MAG: addiction module component CHP02574 family protein [Candidatus Desantisbacteria bacterium CG_4_8_14_3_um_filter_40_12]PIY18793.1 MAG: addiction module component CHP02574 family protein [Candidatus Desantisbacteria bacterium CG_